MQNGQPRTDQSKAAPRCSVFHCRLAVLHSQQAVSLYPRQREHTDRGRARVEEDRGAGVGRRSRREHVIHQEQASAGNPLGSSHDKGAAHVPPARRRVPLLGWRGPHAREAAPFDGQPVASADGPRQDLGLVESSAPASAPVERHRHHGVPPPQHQICGRLLRQEGRKMAEQTQAPAVLAEEDGRTGHAAVPVPKGSPCQRELVSRLPAALAERSVGPARRAGGRKRPPAPIAACRRHSLQRVPAVAAEGATPREVQGASADMTRRGERQVKQAGHDAPEGGSDGGNLTGVHWREPGWTRARPGSARPRGGGSRPTGTAWPGP